MVVASADGDTAPAADVLPGQAGDAPHRARLLDRVPVVGEVAGDNGSGGSHPPEGVADRPQRPPRWLGRRSAGRGPARWSRYREGDRERNRVGRLVGRAEPFRRAATRYDELEATDPGLPHPVLGFIRGRRLTNVNTA